MQNDRLFSLRSLSDADLITRVKGFVARDRQVTAQLIAHLAELDTRDVHLREGYASLYVYCRDALGFSEWEAYNRIEVARAARRFPLILDLLAQGKFHLTTVRLLAPHLTPSNHREVLEEACGKKKPQVEAIVARLSPQADVPSLIRRLPTPRAIVPLSIAAPASAGSGAEAPLSIGVAPARTAVDPVPPALDVPGAVASDSPVSVTPLVPDRYKLQVTIGGATVEKLRLAKDMLSHAIPCGDDATVLDRALTALLTVLAKAKFAATAKPRASRGTRRGARCPSANVKRAVWLRDLGRCAFVAPSGHRCDGRRFLEFHHRDPYALGGEASVDQIQLLCRRHNDYEGRLYFGRRRGGGGVEGRVGDASTATLPSG